MKRKIFMVVLALAATMIIPVPSFDQVSAQSESFTEHMSAYGSTVIDIAGHPPLLIDAYHIDSGEFGSGDVLRLAYYQDTSLGPVFQNVAVFTDMPDRVAFIQQLYSSTPTSIQLVGSSDLEVMREGKSKTIMIVWKAALAVPTEDWLDGVIPAFSVHPGRLILRGRGGVVSGTMQKLSPSGLWFQILTWTGYYADVTFVCPGWHFGGPVGEDDAASPAVIFTDAELDSGPAFSGTLQRHKDIAKTRASYQR